MKAYRVCVADDCPEAAAVLCEGLEIYDYNAVLARDGAEALEICRTQAIDLILLDVCMPGMDGYEVCERLKADPKTSGIEVIFVTVKGSPEDVSHGRALGASDYISKPYNLPMVMLRVDAVLRNKALKDQLRLVGDAIPDSAYTDLLTGLRTRKYLMERLQEEIEKGYRYGFPVSCVVFDVDEVIALDEDLGTIPLDDLLVDVAITLRNEARCCDIVARCDLSEYAAVLPHASLNDAVTFANRITQEVVATAAFHPLYPTQVSLSTGIVTCEKGNENDGDYVFREAMCRLLEAKSLSKDRLVARALTAA